MEIRTTASVECASFASISLRQIFEREMSDLLWLAKAIVGDPLVAESCIAGAKLRADGSSYVDPNWRDLWIRRCVAREAVEKNCEEIKRIAANNMRDAICKRPPDPVAWDKEAIRSLTPTKISESLNVFERSALILHGYLGFSAHDCATLTDCHWSLIEYACSSAIRRLFSEQIEAEEGSAKPGVSEVIA